MATISVTEAANMLEMSEYDVFKSSFHAWYGHNDSKAVDVWFHDYLLTGYVPHFARVFCRALEQRRKT